MAVLNDFATTRAAFGSTMLENDPYVLQRYMRSDTTDDDGPRIGSFSYAAYMYFNEELVDAGANRTADPWYGAQITSVELKARQRCMQDVDGGYPGQLYTLTHHIDPQNAWWANILPNMGAVLLGTIPATKSESMVNSTVAIWKTGDDFGRFTHILENGLVVRANIGNTIVVNKVSVYGINGDNACELYVYYSSVKPIVTDPLPKNGYISPKTGGKLTWKVTHNTPDVYGEVKQQSALVQIRYTQADDVYEYPVDTPDNFFEVTPEMLTDSFQWRVQVETKFGEQSDWTDWANVSIVDALSKPVCVTPVSQIVDGMSERRFAWRHVISTGTKQTAWKMQYSTTNIDWFDVADGVGEETDTLIDMSQFAVGNFYWRVQTANADEVFGAWSDSASIIVRSAPSTPTIAVTGNAVPEVTWTGSGQYGYEIVVDDVESTGVLYGDEKHYRFDRVFPDGEYAIKLRIVNEFGLTSPWAEAVHVVENVPLSIKPVATAAIKNALDVEIAWIGDVTTKTLIYRDGTLIAQTDGALPVIDHTATQKHSYIVRSLNENGNYADSDPVLVNLNIKDAAIACKGQWEWLHIGFGSYAEPPTRSVEIAPVYALNYYSGRERPVVEMSKHKSVTYGITYALTHAEAAKLRAMVGKIVVHKRAGELIVGLLQTIAESRTWWGVDATLQITEVDEL